MKRRIPATRREVTLDEGTRRGTSAVNTPTRIVGDVLQVGGRLRFFRLTWEKLDPWAHSIVSEGLYWVWKSTPPRLHRFSQKSTPVLKEYVKELLDKKVIRPVRSIKHQARLFTVPKKNSMKVRVILDSLFSASRSSATNSK